MRLALVTLAALCLASSRALAQSPACAPDDAECACAQDDTCWAWEHLYSGRNALLGLRATLSIAPSGSAPADGALLTTYAVERHVTVHEVSGHVAASASIGGGTAGTEGSLLASADFGWRVPASRTSGPLLRAGFSSSFVGNDHLRFSMFEPFRLLAGFQVLDRELLLEGGLATGLVAAGSFAAPGGDGDNLARSGELGTFFSAQVGAMRFATKIMYLPEGLTADGITLTVASAALCVRATSVAVCGDALYASGTSQARRGRGERASVLYSGLTVGLIP